VGPRESGCYGEENNFASIRKEVIIYKNIFEKDIIKDVN
jgi:hypothetical protein